MKPSPRITDESISSSRDAMSYGAPSSRYSFCHAINDTALCSIQSGLIESYLLSSTQPGAMERWNKIAYRSINNTPENFCCFLECTHTVRTLQVFDKSKPMEGIGTKTHSIQRKIEEPRLNVQGDKSTICQP